MYVYCIEYGRRQFNNLLFSECQYQPGKFLVTNEMKKSFDEDGLIIVR